MKSCHLVIRSTPVRRSWPVFTGRAQSWALPLALLLVACSSASVPGDASESDTADGGSVAQRDAGAARDGAVQDAGNRGDAAALDAGRDASTAPDANPGNDAAVPSGAPTAKEAAAAMGHGMNLGQMFESTQHPRTLDAARAKIDAYYAKGFRNVRIPITWTEPVGGDLLVNNASVGDVNRSHQRLAVITQVVDYALGKGMYVIINAHHETTLKTERRAAVLERLWQDIADIFKTRDHRLLFELLNEPHMSGGDAAMPAADLRAMSSKAYAKIRAVDSKRIILLGGNQWFGAGEMAQVWPNLDGVGGGDDPYVMATFHHYSPWEFCGDNRSSYTANWTDSDQSDPMTTMLSWANGVGKGMPVYIGEWGVGWGGNHTTMDCNNIRAWYESFDKKQASTKGIPTSVWDDGGWFKVFDHNSSSFANNLADCIAGTCAWNGTNRFNDACR